MKDILCYNIDAESEDGVLVAKRFKVSGYPALIMLSPDGSPEDKIGGYLPPDKFKKEIQRVRSGKDTAGDFRKQVEADKASVDKRFKLARKLKELGDKDGHDKQMAEIKKLDPQGKSLPMHQLAYDEVISKINAGWEEKQTLDTAALAAFLAKETYPEILFNGWNSMIRMQSALAEKAGDDGQAEEAKKLKADIRTSMRNGWKSCPEDQKVGFGNNLAWSYYEARDEITPADKAFALEVAEKAAVAADKAFALEVAEDAAAAADKLAGVIDTYACCLFMNGKKEAALKQVLRCIELDPKNKDWKDRLAEFQK